MEFQGKKVQEIRIVDESNNGELIASLTDEKVVTTNGYVALFIPYVEEKKFNDR